MKELMYLNRDQLKKHLIVWLFVTILLALVHFSNHRGATIIGLILITSNYLFVYYFIGLYAFPKYWENKRVLIFVAVLFILCFYWFFGYIIVNKIIPFLGGSTHYKNESLYYYLHISSCFFVITCSFGIISFLNRQSLYKLKLQSEKDKILITKEINFLKTQFNSRLTFDFLNYCRQGIDAHSPETAESVSVFSEMLKYTLQTQPNEKVALNDEIAYIRSFINIQRLLSSNVYVNYICTVNTDGVMIIPRLLITFVENAFKHGVYNNPEFPIYILVSVENDQLYFMVKNKINPNKRVASSHTGLENVKQALEFHYAGNYNLKNEIAEGCYTVMLTIENKRD